MESLHRSGKDGINFRESRKQTDLNRIPLVNVAELLRFTLLNCTRGELADLAVAAVNDAGETLVPCDGFSVKVDPRGRSRTEPELLPSGYVNIAMENQYFLWENPLFLWPFSIAMLNYQRVVI